MTGASPLESIAATLGDEARDAAETWLDELVVLTFRDNRRGGDPIAHTTDGRAVFPDKYRDGDRITPGESWLCTVAKKGDNTFFAAPLARLDEDFFRGLMPPERRRVAEILWAEHRDVVLDELREIFIEEDGTSLLPPQPVHAAVGEGDVLELQHVAQERNELRERLAELSEQYDEAAARLADAQMQLQAMQLAGAESAAHAVETEDRGPFLVRRVAPEALQSDAFTEPFWHGHVSPSGRVVFLKAHARGPLACEEGRLELAGLARVLGEEVSELEAHYDPRHGGYFIRLP